MMKKMAENITECVCECCNEDVMDTSVYIYSVWLQSKSNGIEEYDVVCNKCISTWFIECPEDIVKMELVK